MGGVHPIFGTDENQFAAFLERFDAFKHENVRIVAQGIEITVPQRISGKFVFGAFVKVFPSYVRRIADNEIVFACRVATDETFAFDAPVERGKTRIYFVAGDILESSGSQKFDENPLAGRRL